MQQVVDRARRAELGQFFTPDALADRMARCFERFGDDVRLLDAGAGAGALVAAFVRRAGPRRIHATAYEVDPVVTPRLESTLATLGATTPGFRAELRRVDFLGASEDGFTHAILNPPYRKLRADSDVRRLLRAHGIETTNLYAAFVALAVRRLVPGGELVAITPRSFCNGPYFRSFRRLLLAETCLRRIDVLASRTLFDDVLQENVILHVVKGAPQGDVMVGPRRVPFTSIVRPGDEEEFFHLADEDDDGLSARVEALPATLEALGLAVSTGKVVTFRTRPWLRAEPEDGAGPLVHPSHFSDGIVVWPRAGKKPNALVDAAATASLWMPPGAYVLVKRISSKEEPRRIVAALHEARVRTAFENHLNVFHAHGAGIAPDLALGLRRYLDSTAVDRYFRQFNGHTQVNATDLRRLRYPSRETLVSLAAQPAPPDEALHALVGL